MVAILGPLSEGRLFLQFGVGAGVVFAALGLAVARFFEVTLPHWAAPVLLVGGFLTGLLLVFLGHVAWYRRRASNRTGGRE